MINVKKKYAFISYCHKDKTLAKWLHRKLEAYKLPSEIHNEFDDSRYLRPIFRDETDLSTGILSDEITQNLYNSKYLIVVCSPHSARSAWVSSEVQKFVEWGRLKNIILFVIAGEIRGEFDYRPYFLQEYEKKYPENELLAIDIRQYGKTSAYIRVVAKMLELEFDSLWKRHQKDLKKRILICCLSFVLLLGLFSWFSIPVKLQLNLYDAQHSLPIKRDGVLRIGDKMHILTKYDTTIIEEYSGYLRTQNIPISFGSTYYVPLDTLLDINTFALINNYNLFLKRDSTFQFFAGKVINSKDKPVADVIVEIGSYLDITNENGQFNIQIPLDQQEIHKHIILRTSKDTLFERIDECPSVNLLYILK